ncbi:uncharacterized protein LOC115332081 isoform X2 [Ixodes scapularis]|uniref:uncharacterized protein LOC115332081 isoform X2 n=1 Tax=Ixodes scapularis TaxID=6945 RepID=UPI001A9F02AE|nr:uncharacterized protein LOC115332081 isoform X2 [Ixodes scapularis]
MDDVVVINPDTLMHFGHLNLENLILQAYDERFEDYIDMDSSTTLAQYSKLKLLNKENHLEAAEATDVAGATTGSNRSSLQQQAAQERTSWWRGYQTAACASRRLPGRNGTLPPSSKTLSRAAGEDAGPENGSPWQWIENTQARARRLGVQVTRAALRKGPVLVHLNYCGALRSQRDWRAQPKRWGEREAAGDTRKNDGPCIGAQRSRRAVGVNVARLE